MTTVSAVWWNPFTWFTSDQDDAMASAVGNGSSVLGFFEDAPRWALQHANGDESNFTLWTANAKDKKTEIGFILKQGTTSSTQDRFLRDENNNIIQDDKNKDIKLKYESAKCDGQNCYYISLTNAQAINIDDYIKLGDNSVAIAFQNETKLNYQTPFASWNVSVECEDVPMDDLWIFHQEDKEKWGANGTFEGTKNCIASYESNTPIIENNWKPYIEDPNKKAGSLGDVIQRHELKHYDICSRNFEPYNFTEIQDGENLTIIAYNKSADCTFDYWDSNQGNETIYYLNVSFLSDNFIDPTIEIINITNGVGLENVICESDDFCHLNISDPNLILYMPFDVNTTSSYDWSENENDGSIVGDVTWRSAGKFGGDYDFGGTTDYIAVTSSSSIDLTGNATISYWMNSDGIAAHQSTLGRGPALHRRYAMDVYTSKARFLYANGEEFGVGDVVTGATTLSTGTWYMLTGRFNGTGISIFVNGIEDASLDKTTYPSTGAYNLHIGGNAGLDRWFNGKMDEVMIFNRSLSTGEISALYNATYPRFHTTGNQTMTPINLMSSTYDFSAAYEGNQMRAWEGPSSSGFNSCINITGASNWGTGSIININDSSEPWINCSTASTQRFSFENDISANSDLDSSDNIDELHTVDDPADNGGGWMFVATPDEDPGQINKIDWLIETASGDLNDLWVRFFIFNDSGRNWYQCTNPNGATSDVVNHCVIDSSVQDFINSTGSIHLGVFGDMDNDPGVAVDMRIDYIKLDVFSAFGNSAVNITLHESNQETSNLSLKLGQFNRSINDLSKLLFYTNFEYYKEFGNFDLSGSIPINWGIGSETGGIIYSATRGLNDTAGFELYSDNELIEYKNTSLDVDFIHNNGLTISVWANATVVDNLGQIVGLGGISSEFIRLRSDITGTGLWEFEMDDSVSSKVESDSTPNIGQWYHLVGRINTSGDIRLFVDGVEQSDTAQDKSGSINGVQEVRIGADTNAFDGAVDEIMIFNRSLSNDEIAEMHRRQRQKFQVLTHTPPQNMTNELATTFTISRNASFIVPEFKYIAGNTSNQFWSPILLPNISMEFFDSAAGPVDNEYPKFSIYQDDNGTITGGGNGKFNVTMLSTNGSVYVEINGTNYTAKLLGGAGVIYNTTINLAASESPYIYQWVSYGNGTDNNFNASERNRSYSILPITDIINPNLTIISPLNNTNFTINTKDINFSAYDEIGLTNCWYSNDSYDTNFTTSCTANITNIIWAQGLHNVTVWANDTSGNLNHTSTTFYIDSINPNLTILFPANNTNHSINIEINYSVADSGIGLDSCWYSNDSYSANTSLVCGVNITGITWTNATHNVTIWVNDSLGNINWTSVTFNISTLTINPQIDLVLLYPISNISVQQNQTFNVTVNVTCRIANCGQINVSLDPFTNQSDGFSIASLSGSNQRGIAYDSTDDSFWISDITDNYIFHVNNAGINQSDGFLHTGSGVADGNIRGITYDLTDNTVWIVDSADKYIYHYNVTNGNNLTDGFSTTNAGSGSPRGISYDSSDNSLWIMIYGISTYHFNTTNGNNLSGSFFVNNAGAANPNAISFDTTDESFWITDDTDDYVYHFNSAGVNQSDGFSVLPGITNPLGMTWDNSDNSLWIIDEGDFFVYHFTEPGEPKTGLISNTTGATPFWTNNSNSFPVTLNKDESAKIVWIVNATGDILTNHTFYVYANLTSNPTIGNITGKWNVTINLDTIPDAINPNLTIVFPANNTNWTINDLEINYTYGDETGITNCWYSNDSYSFNTTITCGVNITEITWIEGGHNVSIWVNDTSGNINTTSTTFYIDSINPNLTILFPANNTNHSINIEINYSVADSGIGLDSCWYSNDSYSADTPIVCGVNITGITWIEGWHNVTVWVNDSLNNINKTSVSFKIDTTPPNIQFDTRTPANNSILNQNFIPINITASDVSSSIDTINITVYNSTGALMGYQHAQADYLLFNITGLRPDLYIFNATVNDSVGNTNKTKPRQVRLIKNVAVNNFEVDIDDLILDSSVYQTILNTTINFTKTGHVTFKGVGAVRKFNNAATSTLALRLTINGMVLTDGNVRTVSGLTDRGVFTIPINGTILTAGVNNFTVEAKESGPGAINLSSLEIFGDGDSSNHGMEINHTEQEINLAFASASYINIKNFTFNKSIHSDTIIDITHKFKAGAVSKQPSCYLTNNVTGERTPIYDRFLETASDIGSSGISFISSIASSSETWQLWCKSNDASSIDNNISFYAFSTVDSLQNNISHFSNVTVISTSFEGDDNQILSYYNYEVKNSSAIELMATAIIQSNTGAQVGAASPNLIINSSTLPQANCFESYDRSLSNANDIGTIKVYVNCDGINPGELHNFSLWLNVAAGENITLRNASFGGYEIEKLDTSTGVVPPFVTITTPINNSNLSNTVDVNATVSDLSGFGYSSNVSLLNQADGFIFRILDDIDKNMNRTNVSFDTTAVSDGNYKIQWIVNNTAGFNLDTHNVTTDNTNPNLTITTPANNTNTTSTGLNINFTSLDLNGISSRWYTIGNDTTVNITLQNGNNVTNVTWGEGMHNVTVYTNDTFGNMNQTSVSFRIDTKPPAMQFTNQTFAEGVGLNHITNGTDAGVGLGIRNQGIKFALNQSTNFTINSTGAIRNATDTKAGVYLIRLSMNDSLDNENSTIIKIDVTAIDGINPSVTALTETPVEPINYSQSTKYEFNATITDTNLATVKIEFNDTNYTITSPTGNVYNFTIANLSAGLYNYTWCAEDSYSNFNCSEAGLYNVTRATPEGVLTSTKTFTYSWDGADTTIGLTETQAGDGDVTYVIIKDGVEVGTSDTEGSAGAFVYILNTTATGSQNYTFNSSMDVETLTITQRTGWTNGTINGTQGNFSMTNGTGALNRFINASINGSCVGNGSISVNGTRFNNGVLPLFNVTNLTVGFYNITFKYFGNTNCTGNNQTYWVNVSTPLDIINPNLTIVFPANNTNWTINDLEINYTYGDETGITNCWYSNDSYSANTTITCGNNITGITWIEGKHNVSISINDTSGNVNTTSVTFRIDTTAPTLTIDSPANNTNSTNTGLDVLYTVSDVGVGVETCWYSNDSYSANTILPNCIDISTIVWTYDNHNVTIWVNDSLGNENHKSVTFNMSVAQAPAIKRAACDLSVIYDNPKLPHTPVLGCPR